VPVAQKTSDESKIALLFPGQGVQHVGMGREFYECSPPARATFDEANEVLGYDLAALCFEGPAERLTETDHCQPAVLTTSVAAWRAAEEAGFRGDIAMGHSLGEYSALVASGSLSFEEALRLVVERGTVTTEVARARPGRMAAILGVSEEIVERLCAEAGDVWPANYNCPGQIVASGLRTGVDRLLELASAQGIKTRMLDIDGAFHSTVMSPAAERFKGALAAVRIEPPSLPFLSATSVAVERGERLRGLLAQQLTAPVRFTQTVRAALDMGVDSYVEFGPRKVLTGLVRRVLPDSRTFNVATPEDLATLDELRASGR
jgi:[acyl-carrier-protein] S-malonyltransferase